MKKFINQHQNHILILTALILVAAASGYVGFLGPSPPLQASQPPVIQIQERNADRGSPPPTPRRQTDRPLIKIKNEETFVYTNLDKKYNLQLSNLNLPTTNVNYSLNKANNTSSTAPKNAENTVSATLKVYNSVYKLDLPQESSVYDLMKRLRDQTDFSFSGKEFSGDLGFFVEEINGQKQNPRDNKYWIYYINGEQAKTGISTYIIQPNDLIEWKL